MSGTDTRTDIGTDMERTWNGQLEWTLKRTWNGHQNGHRNGLGNGHRTDTERHTVLCQFLAFCPFQCQFQLPWEVY